MYHHVQSPHEKQLLGLVAAGVGIFFVIVARDFFLTQ
jgi:hypothetical protein